MPKQFYLDDIVTYYHIARAFANGVQSFKELGPVITARIKNIFSDTGNIEDEMLRAMAANVLLNFNLEIELAKKLINDIVRSKSYPNKWYSSPYFCSKDHNFLSGSPVLTAALFVEASINLKRYQ